MALHSRRTRWFALSAVAAVSLAALGCGSTNSFDVGDEDTGLADDDATADGTTDGVSVDTARADGAVDSGTDTLVTDSGGTDTTGTDTTGTDTTGTDTTGTDTTGDTAVTDSGGDTTDSGTDSGGADAADAADTADTTVADAGADTTDTADAACPAPVTGSVFVSPTGSDTTGNGSSACPFVTITKALSTTVGASGPTTINVASGAGAALFTYGTGCTAGAGKCDATPIRVTDGMNKGIVIKGSGVDPSGLVVVGGNAATDTAVFQVNAPNVGFANMTISPRRTASGSGGSRTVGAAGIRFTAPAVASGSEAVVTNVIIDGVIHTSTSESTGSGLELSNGTSPTIGPGVTIVGGDHSVLVTQQTAGSPSVASKPLILSSGAAPSFFHSTQFACVRVDSTNASATVMPTAVLTGGSTDPGRLHLQDCGGNGGVVVDTVKPGSAVNVTNTLIDTSVATAAAYYGIRLLSSGRLVASTGVTITGINELAIGTGAGIEAGGTSAFGSSIAGGASLGVVVTKNLGSGVRITGNAVADIGYLTSTGNRRNGLLCDATAGASSLNLNLRNSTLTSNGAAGAFITGKPGGGSCVANLGSATAAGNNVFNTTAAKNGSVGLCYTASTAATPTTSTWGCGLASGTACTAAVAVGAPSPLAVAGCDLVGDYNTSAMLTVVVPQTCCGL